MLANIEPDLDLAIDASAASCPLHLERRPIANRVAIRGKGDGGHAGSRNRECWICIARCRQFEAVPLGETGVRDVASVLIVLVDRAQLDR